MYAHNRFTTCLQRQLIFKTFYYKLDHSKVFVTRYANNDIISISRSLKARYCNNASKTFDKMDMFGETAVRPLCDSNG